MQSLSWGNLCPEGTVVLDTWMDMDMDDSLTSLEWLQVACSIPGAIGGQGSQPGTPLSILHHQPPPIFICNQLLLAPPEGPLSPLAGDLASMDTPPIPSKPIATTCSHVQNKILPGMVSPSTVDYRTNSVKPPYSCATLICMAMQDSEEDKVPVSYLYEWISSSFAYFHHADQTWKNTVRHNLSTQKGFIKVLRQKGEPSRKGGYWRVDPQYAESLLTGTLSNSMKPSVQIHSALHTPLQAGSPPTAPGHWTASQIGPWTGNQNGPWTGSQIGPWTGNQNGPWTGSQIGPWTGSQIGPCNPTGSQTGLCPPTGSQTGPYTNLESQQRLDAAGGTSSRDPHHPEGTTLGGSCLQAEAVRRQKRKRSAETGSQRPAAKVPRCSSSPLLLSVERKEEQEETLPGDFDVGAFIWDAFLKSACGGELSPPESRERLSTVSTGEDQTVDVHALTETQSVPFDVIEPCADWMDPFVETVAGFGEDSHNITHAVNMTMLDEEGCQMEMESMFLTSDNRPSMLQLLFMDL